MELIKVEGAVKQYSNGVTAVNNIDLEIKKGDFAFIIGASGSGKSTLMKLFYREEKPTRGKILIGGINVAKLKNRKVYVLRRKLGVVFQDFKLLPKKTVYENVAYALEVLGKKNTEIREATLKALDLVGLKSKTKYYPDKLSGGEQQRVAIARAIVNNPKILLCDEPTGNLDPDISMDIMRVLEEINKLGTTVLVVTHDKTIVDKMKKRVIVLNDGMVKKDYKKGTYDNEIV